MRTAPARRQASASNSSSRKCVSNGGEVDCRRKTSCPRRLSRTATCSSPSGKRCRLMTPSRVPSVWATASANGRLAPPESNVRVLMRGSRLELELQREELQQVLQRDDARQPAILHDQ